MSIRTLKKLNLINDSVVNVICESDGGKDTDVIGNDSIIERKTGHNNFSLLTVQFDSQSESEIKEDDNQSEPDMELEAKGAKKKKKKRKKRSHKSSARGQSSEDYLDKDEFEESLRNLNLTDQPQSKFHAVDAEKSKVRSEAHSLLSIEHKQLNPENELRKIFGSKVIQNEKKKVRGRSVNKSFWLITPKSEWFPVNRQGISMNIADRCPNYNVFTFEHSLSYQQIQMQFLDVIRTSRHDLIAGILNKQPYHIDSLLLLSDLYKMGEDYQMAADMIQRALHSFEAALHPMFNLSTGCSRLSYKRQENRGFFIAIFKHLNFVAQKACYRTALELCKLLLSLDPESDPLGVLLMIDTYALKAREYAFFIRLYSEWKSLRNLDQLPNFAYSIAIAYYHEGESDPQLLNKADNLLQAALTNFPGVLLPLLDKCGVQPDPEVSNCALFGNEVQLKQPNALKQLIQMYVVRNFGSWKDPAVVCWLERNTKMLMSTVDIREQVKSHIETVKSRYQGMPKSILRHIILSDIKDLSIGSDVHESVFSHDPFPPKDSESGYSPKYQQVPRQPSEGEGILTSFFRSIFPTYRGPGQQQDTNATEQDAAGAASEWRNVNFMLDSIREFLADFSVPTVPVEGGEETDEAQDPD